MCIRDRYTETLREMEQHWASPYAMFEALADYYERLGYTGIAINRLTRYEILFGFLQETEPEKTERYRDLLTYDLYPVSYTHLDVYKRQEYRLVQGTDRKWIYGLYSE